MSHPNEFPKPDELRWMLGAIVGDGLLVTEGAKHRHQRKVMNPAFGPVQIRELTSIMVQKSQELCDVLQAQFADAKSPASGEKAKTQIDIDIFSWLNKVTLDIIGLADAWFTQGFGYSFDALRATEDNPNELNAAISKVFAFDPQNLFANLKFFAPILRRIPTPEQRDQYHAMRTMRRIGNTLIAEKKAAVRAEPGAAVVGRDLLSLLITFLGSDFSKH
ncbi:hypothetical protein EWM64_g6667 [Hericium alpestre]|uniref:Cytochrome P450 n=1 Tax=Hericium alpestre TaxID=135208 RepID=A0A4Y9ZRY1_9AGAM|nr:hypothetical protein EWM64_g6667 [Hericium alpestre]